MPHYTNVTYKLVDFNLNIIDTFTVLYENYTDIEISELSENIKMNEFLVCVNYYISATICNIVKYQNSILNFSENHTIFPRHNPNKKEKCNFLCNYYELSITLFDEDKIGCILTDNYYNIDFVKKE